MGYSFNMHHVTDRITHMAMCCPSVRPFVCLSDCRPIYLVSYIQLPFYPSIHLPISLSVRQPTRETDTQTHTQTQTDTPTQRHSYTHTHAHTHILTLHTHTNHTHSHITHTLKQTHSHSHSHTHTHTHTHAHTHTNTSLSTLVCFLRERRVNQ